MSVIWRFDIPLGVRDFFVSVPQGSRFMKLIVKGEQPQIYFRVPDTEAPPGDVMFFVIPTGVPLTELEERAQYIDSFVIPPVKPSSLGCDIYIPDEELKPLVFHLFIEAANV